MTKTMRAGWTVFAAAALVPAATQAQSWNTVTMSRQLENAEEVRVDVEYGAGHFTVRSIDEGLLYRMNLRYDENEFEPVADYSGDRLRLGVESIGRNLRVKGREAGSFELELARGVPMDLNLDFGAVKADIDLGGLALTDLDLSTGASESVVDVSEPNPLQMGTATFEVGATCSVPRVTWAPRIDRSGTILLWIFLIGCGSRHVGRGTSFVERGTWHVERHPQRAFDGFAARLRNLPVREMLGYDLGQGQHVGSRG